MRIEFWVEHLMGKSTKYASKKPDENGYIAYSEEEDRIWSELYARQMEILPGRACSALGAPRPFCSNDRQHAHGRRRERRTRARRRERNNK